MSHLPADYELIIRPTRGWLRLDLAGLWRYRDLLFLLVHRDFVARYKQTVLGPAWFILQPLIVTIVFTVVFGHVARIPTDGLPPMLFYLTGLLGWTYFAQTFQSTAGTLIANASLLGKVYFPRLVVPLSAVLSNFFAFTLQLATLIGVWLYFKIFTSAGAVLGLSLSIALLPLLIVQIAALSLGAGLWLAALTVKYRDFTHLTPLLIQIWMYATPVIYPLSAISAKWRWLAVLNPMTVPTEAIKRMFLGQGTVVGADVAVSIGLTVFLLLSGVLVFNRVEKTFVDAV